MPSSNNDELISRASPHTVKKFELIQLYIESWAQKLMNNKTCNGLIFIDCMCNSGLYHNDKGDIIEGTPIRVAKVLRDVSGQYPTKRIYLYFNDLDSDKIALLKSKLPPNKDNFRIITTDGDGNELLKSMGAKLNPNNHFHYFLLYDPYDASIDWAALLPFFRNWGEVMINHMVSDPIRAIKQVRKTDKKLKYENTYLTEFEKLVPYGSDKNAYEARIEQIIKSLKGQRRYYVAAFPFYNSQNSQVYSLIHCTGNIEGFKLYKTSAWKTFGAKSSTKNGHENEDQLTIDFTGQGLLTTTTDESCFVIRDIAKYLQKSFAGRGSVSLDELWNLLDIHPIFPGDGFRNEIRKELKETFGANIKIIPNKETGARETVVTFREGCIPI